MSRLKNSLLLTIVFLSSQLSVQAQKEVVTGVESITETAAKAYINFLASDALLGREAGSQSGKVSAEFLTSQLQLMGIGPLLESYTQSFEAVQVYVNKGSTSWRSHPDSVALLSKAKHRLLKLQNVLGMIPGKNSNEYVMVGAHYDHLGIDPLLVGDSIFNGADDNASGVSAVLQIANAFVKSGKKPERNVVFAFWDGEEKGLLGSQYFVAAYPHIKKIKSYLNFDMIGRNNDEAKPKHVVFFYTAAHKSFEQWLRNDIKEYNLALEPDYRAWDNPVGGSDNGSFAKVGIPILWYHTDGHPDYHHTGDEASKINWPKLIDITRAAFLNVWNMANEKDY